MKCANDNSNYPFVYITPLYTLLSTKHLYVILLAVPLVNVYHIQFTKGVTHLSGYKLPRL